MAKIGGGGPKTLKNFTAENFGGCAQPHFISTRALVRILKVPAQKKISVQLRSQNIFLLFEILKFFKKFRSIAPVAPVLTRALVFKINVFMNLKSFFSTGKLAIV